MKTILLMLALFLSTAAAQEGTTDLWTLFGDGDSTLPGGDAVYQLRSGHGLNVNVAATFGDIKGEGYRSLYLTAFKFGGSLTTAELQLFGRDIIRIATTCFNADPTRGPAIQNWLVKNDAIEDSNYTTSGTRLAERSFGPLQLSLEKRASGHGHAVTIYMSRSGIPGQAPWIKSCIASG